MAEQRNWAEEVAARVAGRPAPQVTVAEPVRPAWARVLADRAAGRTPDAETVREARKGPRPDRKPWEAKLLARLGHTPTDGGPTAA